MNKEYTFINILDPNMEIKVKAYTYEQAQQAVLLVTRAFGQFELKPDPVKEDDLILGWAVALQYKSLSVHELVENAKWLIEKLRKPQNHK